MLVVGAAWYFTNQVIGMYTSSAPSAVRIEAPSEAQYAAASAMLEQMRTAAARNEAGTFEFSAADVNALIARHPNFTELRDKVRVDIEGENMLVDLSVPLAGVAFPGLSKRWLNGAAKFGLNYDDGSFDFALRSVTANDREIPVDVLPAIDTSFDDAVNTGFKTSQQKNRASEELWEHIKSMRIVDNKLVVTTKPADPAAPEPAP